MKKYLIQLLCIVAIAGALAGCVKDSTETSGSGDGATTLTATIASENATRSALIDNQSARKIEVRWMSGDAIGIFGSQSGTNVRYTANAISEDGKTAQFTTTATPPSGELYAYHPYKDGTTVNGSVLGLTMPAVQTYTLSDGVPMPDAAANIMAGKGTSANGIVFRNLFAILRISFAPESVDDVIKKVEFTDLSGKPVSGTFTVMWDGDGIPSAAFPASAESAADKVITLDCSAGAATGSGSQRFFMIVPAREYAQGFKVAFVLADGSKVEKTVGTAAGKTLKRNGVYNIGHLPEKYENIEYKLSPGATILSGDRMDEIVSMRLGEGVTGGTALILMVNKAFGPQMDERIVINETSELLPDGFVGRVQTWGDMGSGLLEVFLVPEEDITKVFEDLVIGEASLYNADGSVNPEGGIEIDLASYVTRIEMSDGTDVPFSLSGSTISFADAPFTMQGVEARPLTRGWGDAQGSGSGTISLPNIAYTFDMRPDDLGTLKVTVGCQMAMKLFLATKIETFIPTYIDARADMNLNFNMQFTAAAEVTLLQESKHLLTLYCASIPAGPVLITPKVELYLTAGAGGALEVSSRIEYTKSASFGFTYGEDSGLKGNNTTTKEEAEESSPWKAPSGNIKLSGHVSFGGMAYIGIGMWKMFQVLLTTGNSIKTEARWNIDWNAVTTPGYGGNSWIIDDTGLNVDYENQLGVELRAFRWTKHLQLDPFSFPIYQGYFVPELSNFAVSYKPDGTLNLSVTAKRKTIWGVVVGADICERTDNYNAGSVLQSVVIDNYMGGDNAVTLEKITGNTLDNGKAYRAWLTVEFMGRKIITDRYYDFTIESNKAAELRKILKEIYVSLSGDEWNDNLFVNGVSQVPWMGVSSSSSGNPDFRITIGNDAPGTHLSCDNNDSKDVTWSLSGESGCKVEAISVTNDGLTGISGFGGGKLREVIANSKKLSAADVIVSDKLAVSSPELKSITSGVSSSEEAWTLDASGSTNLEKVSLYGVLKASSWLTLGPSVKEVSLTGPFDGTLSTTQDIDLSRTSVQKLTIKDQSNIEVVGNLDMANAALVLTSRNTDTPSNISITNWRGTIGLDLDGLSHERLALSNLTIVNSLINGGNLVLDRINLVDLLTITNCGMTGLNLSGVIVREFDVSGCNNLTTVNLQMPNNYIDANGQTVANTTSLILPEFLLDMVARGISLTEPAVTISWRYDYRKSSDDLWFRWDGNGGGHKYGFYLYDSEPVNSSIDRYPVIDGYQNIGRTTGVEY